MSKSACILVAQGVQDEEFIYPYYRLQEANFDLDVVFVTTPKYNKPEGKYGIPFHYDYLMDELTIEAFDRYDLFIIPGGWQAPEIMRMDNKVIDVLRLAEDKNKIIAAICHGPQVLISAGVGRGKQMTGFAGIRHDIENAGYDYVHKAVVNDGGIITSPHYKNNPDFMREVLRQCS